MLRIFISVIYLLFASFSAWADQLIIEPDMGRKPILNAIHDTRYSLDLVMYGLTDQPLLDALIKQKLNGRTLKIILEEHPYKAENENNKAIRELNNNHVAWQGTAPAFRLTHQKTLIVDNEKAIIMTFNFTRSAFKNDRNFALIIDDPKRVKAIKSVFSADWNHQPIVNHSPDLIFSPDGSRQQIVNLIHEARQSISIYAQNLSDYQTVGALAKAARKGVKVNILTSSKPREKQADYLSRAGVHIRQSKQRYIHAKVFILDGKKAVIGSINLTRASFDNNRELSVVTQDNSVVKQLEVTFQEDWDTADKVTEKYIKDIIPDKHTMLRTIRLIKQYINQQ